MTEDIGANVNDRCWRPRCTRPVWYCGAWCLIHAGTACQATTRHGWPCRNRGRDHGAGPWCHVHDPYRSR